MSEVATDATAHERALLQDRLTDLELKYMEQGAIIDDLSELVHEQAVAFERLQTQVRHLQDLLNAGPDEEEGNA